MSRYWDAPTVSDVNAFMEAINAGREAAGLAAIVRVPFDDCLPSNGELCLSATMLGAPLGLFTGTRKFQGGGGIGIEEAMAAIDAVPSVSEDTSGYVIPDVIRRVTDPFDSNVEGTREAFEMAGWL